MAQNFKDYYKILDIPFEASDVEIKSAYRKMARLFHPDMHPEDAESYTAKFQEITAAYETLSDDYKKEVYDQKYRQYVLNEVVYQESYEYYEEPATAYYHYQAPVEPKRRKYAPYGAFIVMAFYFIKMVTSSIPTSTSTDTKYHYDPLPISSDIQNDYFKEPKDTLSSMPATNKDEIKRPF